MKEEFFITSLAFFFISLAFFFLDPLLSSSIYFTEVKTTAGIWEREKKNPGKTKHQAMWQCL